MENVKASQLPYLEQCPRWLPKEDDLNADTTARDSGIRQHKAVHDEPTFQTLPPEEVPAVAFCRNYVKSYTQPELFNVPAEHKIVLPGLRNAYADYVQMNGDEAFLFEYKFGQGGVGTASDNIQLQTYVLGLFGQDPFLDQITAHLLTPNQLPVQSSFRIYRRADIPALTDRIYKVVDAAKNPDSPCCMSDVCRYCGNHQACPAVNEAVVTVVKKSGLPLPSEFDPGKLVLPLDRALAQQLRDILRTWCEAININNTRAVAEQGIEIPGYSLVIKDGGTTISDLIGTWEFVQSRFGVPLKNFLMACSVSLKKLEEQVSAVTQRGGKGNAIKELYDTLEQSGMIEKSNGTKYLRRTRNDKNSNREKIGT